MEASWWLGGWGGRAKPVLPELQKGLQRPHRGSSNKQQGPNPLGRAFIVAQHSLGRKRLNVQFPASPVKVTRLEGNVTPPSECHYSASEMVSAMASNIFPRSPVFPLPTMRTASDSQPQLPDTLPCSDFGHGSPFRSKNKT